MIKLEYFAQAKQAAGCESDEFDSDSAQTLEQLISKSCERHDRLGDVLLRDGELAPWIIVSINGNASSSEAASVPVADGDTVRLISPISGG